MLLHSRNKRWIAKWTAILMILTLVPVGAAAATGTTWSQAAYDNVSETWTPGNIVRYYEGSYVPYRANAEDYVPTGQTIDFDLDYLESGTGALGYDQATNWFIGPYVPYSDSPTLYTKSAINTYAQTTYGHPVIEPDTQFMGADAFIVNPPTKLTSGGDTIPDGYTGDTILRYHLEPNVLGYAMGEPAADPGSFIDALMTWYDGDWAIYYEAHLAESGAPNLFEGGTVVLGAGAYNGSSLQITFDKAGEKAIPLPTNGLAKKDYYVEKTWANPNDAEPVTIKLMGQKGETGTPYVAAAITLDGTADTNTNPEYEAWKGKFVNLPIYYTTGGDVFPISYTVVEDPVPTGFLTPVYGGSAATAFTVYNEKIYGSLTVQKTVDTNDAIGLTVPGFEITITGPSYPDGDAKTFNQTNGMTQTWENLLPGVYTVTESGIAAPWSVDISPETYEVTGGANTTVDVSVSNSYDPGSLTVRKMVITNDTVGLVVPDFEIAITGPSYPDGDVKTFNQTTGMTQTWENLIPGEYIVSEPDAASPWSVEITPAIFDVESGEDTDVDVTVTNTYEPGSLTVLKVVDTNEAIGLTVPDFEITVTGPSYPDGYSKTFSQTEGMTQTWDNLIPGEYTVTEPDVEMPWNVVIEPETVMVASGDDTEVDVTVTNEYTTGTLKVTKEIMMISDDPEATVTYTFHVALFEDQGGELVRITEIEELQVLDSASTYVVFEHLALDKTYYVFETDGAGDIIGTEADGTITTPILPDWTKITYENAMVRLTPTNINGESTVTNVFEPQDKPLYGSILIKKFVTVDGKETASKRTFYVALFADEALTQLISEIKPLMMNGNTFATAEFLTDKDAHPLEAGTTFYVAETDKNGVPLKGGYETLGYEISIDKPVVVIVKDETLVTIINKFKKEEFPLTGDPFKGNFWLFLAMLGITGAIAPVAFRKKEDTAE